MAVAVVTGASRGLGLALAEGLAARGWSLVIDGRNEEALAAAESAVRAALATGAAAHAAEATGAGVRAVAGDVSDPDHRRRLVDAARDLGGIDLVVNNASVLGPSPQPPLGDYPLDELRRVYEVNVVAPVGLIADTLPLLRLASDARVLNVTSDASVEPYGGWGGYGSSKAALDHVSAILAVEEPGLTVWAVDPGDMRTRMHQEAFPGEDISDRPLPASVVPALVDLIEVGRPSGRYRASELAVARPAPATVGQRSEPGTQQGGGS